MRQEGKKLKLGTKRVRMKGELSGDLGGCFSIVYLARVAVHPIGQAVHITLRERRKVCTFGEEAPNETVGVFIASPLGRAVGMSVIEGSTSLRVSTGVTDGGRIQELRAVITGNGFDEEREACAIVTF